MRRWRWGFWMMGMLVLAAGNAWCEESVRLQLSYPDGRTAVYKNSYSLEYVSDEGNRILSDASPGEWVNIQVNGEWKSRETVQKADAESAGEPVLIRTAVEDAFSGARRSGNRMSYQEYSFGLDQFNDKTFTWQAPDEGPVKKFSPDFAVYTLPRQDMVVDLWQIWMPEYRPVLPDKEVSKGDTWTAEQTFEMPFVLMNRKALVGLKSTYRVKEIRKKKDRTTVELEEKRQVRYRSWLAVGLLSVLLDGSGEGSGKWELDNTRGIVLLNEMKMEIKRPEVTVSGHEKPLDRINAEYKVRFKRELEEVKE